MKSQLAHSRQCTHRIRPRGPETFVLINAFHIIQSSKVKEFKEEELDSLPPSRRAGPEAGGMSAGRNRRGFSRRDFGRVGETRWPQTNRGQGIRGGFRLRGPNYLPR